MSDLFWLSEAQVERLRPYFPKSRGKARVDDRRVLSGIIFIQRNGLMVSARFLPQRLVLDAGDDVGFGGEVIEEAVPFLDRHACGIVAEL